MWRPGAICCNADAWVEAARRLPVAFAQVREDPTIDQELLLRLDRPPRVLMIASAGETAALLASHPCVEIHLVDVNAAQLALCRLKLQLLTTASGRERLQLLGYEPMDEADRAAELSVRLNELNLSLEALGPAELVGSLGPDFCGRYEWAFARMRDLLADVSEEINDLLSLAEVEEQSRRAAVGSRLGGRLEQAFQEVMEQSRLVSLFGPDATANRLQPFADHFLQRLRWALASIPARENPFLHQMLLGRFPGPRWLWLDLPRQAAVPRLRFTHASMGAVLEAANDQSYDYIHLSNVLDWIGPSEAEQVLREARRCLRPSGLVVIRQLNSQLVVEKISCGLRWMRSLGDELLRADRSFFYRDLHIGVRE